MNFARAMIAFTVAAAFSACGEKKPNLGDYPLDTCVVAGKKLGSMGEPYLYTHEGQKVYFCCDGCVDEFKKDPKKYLAKIEAARKK